MVARVTVRRSHWRTYRDRDDEPRLRHEAVIEFEGGIVVKTTRLSKETAERLLAAGAVLVDRTKGTRQ